MDKEFKKIFDKLSGIESEADKVVCVMNKYQEYLDLLVEKGILTIQDTRMKFFTENQEVLSFIKQGLEEDEDEDDDAEEESEDRDDAYDAFKYTSSVFPETDQEKRDRKIIGEIQQILRDNGITDFSIVCNRFVHRRKPRG